MPCGKHQQSRHKKGEIPVTPPTKWKWKQSCPSFLTLWRKEELHWKETQQSWDILQQKPLIYYDALIPSYRILSKCLRDLYENTCDLLFYTYTRKISMLFNIKQYTNKEFILISTQLLLTVSSYIYVLFLHTQLSGIFIFIFNAY